MWHLHHYNFFVTTFLFRKELCSQMSTPRVVSFILWSVRTEQKTNLMPNCSYQIVCCLRKADTSGVYLRLFLVTALGLCWKQCYGVCLSGEFLTILRVKNQMREKATVHTKGKLKKHIKGFCFYFSLFTSKAKYTDFFIIEKSYSKIQEMIY